MQATSRHYGSASGHGGGPIHGEAGLSDRTWLFVAAVIVFVCPGGGNVLRDRDESVGCGLAG